MLKGYGILRDALHETGFGEPRSKAFGEVAAHRTEVGRQRRRGIAIGLLHLS